MQKVLHLMDTAIAVLLLVIALSVHLKNHFQVHQALENRAEQVMLKHEADLRYSCDGTELLALLAVLGQEGEPEIVYLDKTYGFVDFCSEVLGLSASPELSYVELGDDRYLQLKQQNFKIYQKDGKWRVEN